MEAAKRRRQMKDELVGEVHRHWNDTHKTVTRFLWTPESELQQRRASAAGKLHSLIAYMRRQRLEYAERASGQYHHIVARFNANTAGMVGQVVRRWPLLDWFTALL
jgi:hypothetical protein